MLSLAVAVVLGGAVQQNPPHPSPRNVQQRDLPYKNGLKKPTHSDQSLPVKKSLLMTPPAIEKSELLQTKSAPVKSPWWQETVKKNWWEVGSSTDLIQSVHVPHNAKVDLQDWRSSTSSKHSNNGLPVRPPSKTSIRLHERLKHLKTSSNHSESSPGSSKTKTPQEQISVP